MGSSMSTNITIFDCDNCCFEAHSQFISNNCEEWCTNRKGETKTCMKCSRHIEKCPYCKAPTGNTKQPPTQDEMKDQYAEDEETARQLQCLEELNEGGRRYRECRIGSDCEFRKENHRMKKCETCQYCISQKEIDKSDAINEHDVGVYWSCPECTTVTVFKNNCKYEVAFGFCPYGANCYDEQYHKLRL